MRNAKVLLCAALFMAVLACGMLAVSGPTTAAAEKRTTAAEKKTAVGNHWRHHDGHWSYWHEADKQWYYTDGSSWFSNNGDDGSAWTVYGFDKDFGREGFEKGEYKAPRKGAKIQSPRHAVYRAPRK